MLSTSTTRVIQDTMSITECLTISTFNNKKWPWTTIVSGRYMITMMMLLCYVNSSGGQICTDSVSTQRLGTLIDRDRLAIIPRLRFTCDGRITSIRARVFMNDGRYDYPFFQVWRPASDDSIIYNKIGEVQLQSDDQVTIGSNNLSEANITLTGNNRIQFQSGDVVGYYHPPNARYRVIYVQTFGYSLYQFELDGSPIPTSVNLTNTNVILNNTQPLIQFAIDIRCDDLSTPANGMMSCNSGRVGVGYEGDTCSFICNTGYELTGSDTRTCQSDMRWSGSDGVCRRVSCLSLNNPDNGLINCSLGDDEVPSYEDTCSFTCNTGYKLTGSDTRTCQSDGSWSGSDVTCSRVFCPSLTHSTNGMINCSLGDDGIPSYQDTCSFTCNTGYELTDSSNTRTCQSNGSWSGINAMCTRVTSSSGKSDSSNVAATIGGAVGGAILFVSIATLFIIMLWCVRLSHRRKAITNGAFRSTDAKMKIGKDDLVRPIEPVPPYNRILLEETIKTDVNPSYGLATNISNAKPGDYDYAFNHSIQQSNVNSTQTEYLSLYHTDPDAAIKMDVNPSYGSAMQNVNTSEAGVKNDYDYIVNGSIHHPSHCDVLKKSIARINEDEIVYGPVNQPISDVAAVDETV